MEVYTCNSYKIANKLPLDKIEDNFQVRRKLRWKEYILLEGPQLKKVFHEDCSNKRVVLFQYGCICFFNLTEDEISFFLQYLETLIGAINHSLFLKFNERHTIMIDNKGMCNLSESSDELLPYKDDYAHILCIILAKSVELSKLEVDLEELFDYSEKFINNLQQGRLRAGNKKFTTAVSKMLRVEYQILNNIHVFERIGYSDSIESKKVYDLLSTYYELEDRCSIMQQKIRELRHIYKPYASLSYKNSEIRLYWLEIVLLGLFPLSYFLH